MPANSNGNGFTFFDNRVWEMDLPPSERLVLIALFRFAPDIRPSHSKISEMTGLSVERVRKIVKSLREKGLIDSEQGPNYGANHYTLILPWETEVSLISPSSSRGGTEKSSSSTGRSRPGGWSSTTRGGGHQRPGGVVADDPLTRQENKTKEQDKEHPAPGGRGEEAPMHLGSLEPDEPKKDPRQKTGPTPRRNTHARCVRRFENEAAKLGHRFWNTGVLHKTIKELHSAGYTYDQIEWAIEALFLRFEAGMRSAKDPALMLRGRRSELSKWMDDHATVGVVVDSSRGLPPEAVRLAEIASKQAELIRQQREK